MAAHGLAFHTNNIMAENYGLTSQSAIDYVRYAQQMAAQREQAAAQQRQAMQDRQMAAQERALVQRAAAQEAAALQPQQEQQPDENLKFGEYRHQLQYDADRQAYDQYQAQMINQARQLYTQDPKAAQFFIDTQKPVLESQFKNKLKPFEETADYKKAQEFAYSNDFTKKGEVLDILKNEITNAEKYDTPEAKSAYLLSNAVKAVNNIITTDAVTGVELMYKFPELMGTAEYAAMMGKSELNPTTLQAKLRSAEGTNFLEKLSNSFSTNPDVAIKKMKDIHDSVADAHNKLSYSKIVLPTSGRIAANWGVAPIKTFAELEPQIQQQQAQIPDIQKDTQVETAGNETPTPGVLSRIAESITGNERMTEEIKNLPNYRTSMPEFSIFRDGGISPQAGAALKAAAGTMATSPEETVKIFQAQFPDIQVRQDEKGNYIFKSGIDKKEYAMKPGLEWSDVPRAMNTVGAAIATPAIAAEGIGGAILTGAAQQVVQEGLQKATGGEINPEDIAMAGGLGGAFTAAGKIGGKIIGAVRPLFKSSDDALAAINKAKNIIPAELKQRDLGELVRKASSEGMGSAKAKQDLAVLAKIDPKIEQTAKELGFELPIDAYSDNKQLNEVLGQMRSKTGSEFSAKFGATVDAAREKAQGLLQSLDASPDIASVSENVKASLGSQRDQNRGIARQIYKELDQKIPETMTVELPSLRAQLQKAKDIAKGKVENMQAAERRLYQMLQDGDITYGMVAREKSKLGEAISGFGKNDFADMDQMAKSKLYAAFNADQRNIVAKHASPDDLLDFEQASNLWKQADDINDRIIEGFGSNNTGSLADLMRSAINSGARGNTQPIEKLLNIVPDDLKKTVLMSSLMNATKNQAGTLSFKDFAAKVKKLKTQAPIWQKIQQAPGVTPADIRIIDGVATLGDRIAQMQANLLHTGKANQEFFESMQAERFVEKLINGVGGPIIGAAVGGAAGSLIGPLGQTAGMALGAGVASKLSNFIAGAKPEIRTAFANLIHSPEFTEFAVKAATDPNITEQSAARLARSAAFSKLTKNTAIPFGTEAKKKWIMSALAASNRNLAGNVIFDPANTVEENIGGTTSISDQKFKIRVLSTPANKFKVFGPTRKVEGVFKTQQEAVQFARKKYSKK
jgi:hypothetical protein